MNACLEQPDIEMFLQDREVAGFIDRLTDDNSDRVNRAGFNGQLDGTWVGNGAFKDEKNNSIPAVIDITGKNVTITTIIGNDGVTNEFKTTVTDIASDGHIIIGSVSYKVFHSAQGDITIFLDSSQKASIDAFIQMLKDGTFKFFVENNNLIKAILNAQANTQTIFFTRFNIASAKTDKLEAALLKVLGSADALSAAYKSIEPSYFTSYFNAKFNTVFNPLVDAEVIEINNKIREQHPESVDAEYLTRYTDKRNDTTIIAAYDSGNMKISIEEYIHTLLQEELDDIIHKALLAATELFLTEDFFDDKKNDLGVNAKALDVLGVRENWESHDRNGVYYKTYMELWNSDEAKKIRYIYIFNALEPVKKPLVISYL